MANNVPEILLFGGAFNPPTVAHIHSAYNAMNYCQWANPGDIRGYAYPRIVKPIFSSIWFLPCYKSRWGKEMTDGTHRLNMLRLAVKEAVDASYNMDVCDFEIANQCTGGSFDIIQEMQQKYPNCKFSFLIGGDHADKLFDWKDGKAFIEKFRFVVVGRDGKKPKSDWFMRAPHIFVPTINDSRAISSTKAREELANTGYTDLVYPSVMSYIREHRLYDKH